MSIDLDELLERVNDEQSFIAFIDALGSDFASQPLLDNVTPLKRDELGVSQWENGSVDTFLEQQLLGQPTVLGILRAFQKQIYGSGVHPFC
ncbi:MULTISPECIES: hypothetical protein [Pseudomonas]|uniref:hypothetical protein n=1 Tax=Pseudomonas TaxID=286 RepID=UPI00191498B5|nr:hypothetical protein [Pseudomonas moraviensis]